MIRAERLAIGILAAVACGLSVMVVRTAAGAYAAWRQRPLGPVLTAPGGRELPATWTPGPILAQPTNTPAPTPTLETATPASPFLACADLPPMTILLIGVDIRSDDYRGGRADVIRAVRVDFHERRLTALEFPRDLWVKIPGIERNLNTDHQKLNTAYAYGGAEFGPDLLARTLELNFGLTADHYVAVSMNIFVDAVDALGGLDITLPKGGIDGRTTSDRSERLVFAEGAQHLNGEQALTLARIRNVSVFQRAAHQNLVMCALRREVESPEAILRLPALIDAFIGNVQTDLTPDQISQLACLGTQMPRRNIVFASFPLELFKPAEVYDPVLKQDVFVWAADFSTLRGYTSEFQEGNWPAYAPSAAPDAEVSACQ